jgi:hypothetical protein
MLDPCLDTLKAFKNTCMCCLCSYLGFRDAQLIKTKQKFYWRLADDISQLNQSAAVAVESLGIFNYREGYG